MTRLSIVLVLASLLVSPTPVRAQIVNGSFETGDLTGWISSDVDEPLIPLQVAPVGTLGTFGATTQPSDGDHSLLTGFEGDGPGSIVLGQQLTIAPSARVLLLDYVARWDLQEGDGGSFVDRTLGVELWGIHGWMGGYEVMRAAMGSVNLDADRVTACVDLAKFAGDPIELDLVWQVPGSLTGPASFELDNVRLAGRKVPVLQSARLAIALDFAQPDADRLDLKLVVPVPLDFSPDDEVLAVSVGGVMREFTLDAAGAGQSGPDSVKLQAVSGQPGYRRLKLACRDADLSADLEAQGLVDMDTGPVGTTLVLPVQAELGGETMTREMVAVYKATPGVQAKAVAKAASEVWRTSLSAKLNLELADEDTLHLKTALIVPPGFVPEGKDVRVDIGDWSKTFTLDASGEAESTVETDGIDRIRLVRDKSNPARQVVTVTGMHGNFGDISDDLYIYEPTPPGGFEVHVPVAVTLDGRSTRSIVTVIVTGKPYTSAKAHT